MAPVLKIRAFIHPGAWLLGHALVGTTTGGRETGHLPPAGIGKDQHLALQPKLEIAAQHPQECPFAAHLGDTTHPLGDTDAAEADPVTGQAITAEIAVA